MNTGMQKALLSVHKGAVYAVDCSPHSGIVASAGADNDIVIWNPTTNEIVTKLSGHNDAVTDLKFTPDGAKLVSISAEGQLKVWNLLEYTELYSRIQISRHEWISTSPSGHFDGSSKALELVNYVSGMDVVHVGSLVDEYFSPGLIKRMSEGESFNDRGDINYFIGSSTEVAFHITESKKHLITVAQESI